MEKGGASWLVVNLQGREGMSPIDSPFAVADRLLASAPEGAIVTEYGTYHDGAGLRFTNTGVKF